jgi:hypothetical protein
VQPPVASDGVVEADLRRSGFIDWNSSAGSGQDLEFVLIPVLWLVNWLTNLIVFQGGWTLRIFRAGDDHQLVSKARYRRKAAALADVERRMQLAHASLD